MSLITQFFQKWNIISLLIKKVSGLISAPSDPIHYFDNFNLKVTGDNGKGTLVFDPIYDMGNFYYTVNQNSDDQYTVNSYEKLNKLKNGDILVIKSTQLLSDGTDSVWRYQTQIGGLAEQKESDLYKFVNDITRLENDMRYRAFNNKYTIVQKYSDDSTTTGNFRIDQYPPATQQQVFFNGKGFRFKGVGINYKATYLYFDKNWNVVKEPPITNDGHGIASVIIEGIDWDFDLLPNFEDSGYQFWTYTLMFPKGNENNYTDPTTTLFLYWNLRKAKSFWDKAGEFFGGFKDPEFYYGVLKLVAELG